MTVETDPLALTSPKSFPGVRIFNRLPSTVSANQLTLLVSVLLIAAYNQVLVAELNSTNPVQGELSFVFTGSVLIILIACLNLLLSMITFRFLQKPILSALIIGSAFCGYFMREYGIVIDKGMMRNLFETDIKESAELLSLSLAACLVFYGVLPVALLCKCKVYYSSPKSQVAKNGFFAFLSLLAMCSVITPQIKSIASYLRNHREIGHLIVPGNFIYYGIKHVVRSPDAGAEEILTIGEDAEFSSPAAARGRLILAVVVLGETARAQNFVLNGYRRNINPELEKFRVYSFSDVSSCSA